VSAAMAPKASAGRQRSSHRSPAPGRRRRRCRRGRDTPASATPPPCRTPPGSPGTGTEPADEGHRRAGGGPAAPAPPRTASMQGAEPTRAAGAATGGS
jgi:hypothetical protein